MPSGRIARLAGFSRLAGGVAGSVVGEGARRMAAGERPTMNELLLTPANAARLADRLSHLRGAAMKMGQMISMDAGDLLPPELSTILASLRDRANFMPPKQLDKVLAQDWGKDWRKQFRRFEPRPIAAASIGQVHRALTRDGRMLAIKVQYPGVAKSIDSDVDNVATLLRVSGLLPKELDIEPLLAAAKEQLHEEADYHREGEQMQIYASHLDESEGFVVPTLDTELTRDRILAMSFEDGIPIEDLISEPQELRDTIFERLLRLVLREMFEFGIMQTDPNFANFRYRRGEDGAPGQIVLLDFGAARPVDPDIAAAYRSLLEAGLAKDADRIREEAIKAGFISPVVIERHPERIGKIIDIIVEEMSPDAPFDFGDRSFVPLLKDEGMQIAEDRANWHLPPAETLFVQRKISGTALLGARLEAKVNVRRAVQETFRRTTVGN